ncbi:MAG: MaoC/PaaZ C-terminal domain-containing protein [Candidatus Nomurabacteria bacterium]|nr:MaoC/PaaZ C-terminal domain-containing protein [Candidatus Nomurabacteria bacterium]
MNNKFKSVEQLNNWLLENKVFSFSSQPKKLRKISILLHSLAGRDFNPAHIVSSFADKSIFKGIVSHGIEILSRAEGYFVQMIQFEKSVEIIALGFESVHYYKPLRLGSVYHYKFEISNLRQVKGRWDFDCQVRCVVGDKIVAEWLWKASFVEHLELSQEMKKVLKPKSYFWNVVNNFFINPLSNSFLFVIGVVVLLSPVFMILGNIGILPQSSVDFSYCF